MSAASLANMVLMHRQRFQNLVKGKGLVPMRSLYREAARDLRERIAELQRTGLGETFTAYQARISLIQVEDAITGFSVKFGRHLEQAADDASRFGLDSLAAEIKAMEPRFSMGGQTLAVEEIAFFTRITDDAKTILREKLEDGVARYGAGTIGRVENQLALSLARGDTMGDATSALVDTFDGNRYRAERVVRTEMANAYEFTKWRGMQETRRQDMPGLQRQIVATFDDRTGEDSKLIHGEIRGVDEAFYDPIQKKHYMHPPNRPNDREYVLPYHSDWGTAGKVARAAKRGS